MHFYLILRENWDKVFVDPMILKDPLYPSGNLNDTPGRLKINNFQGDHLYYLPSESSDFSKNKFI